MRFVTFQHGGLVRAGVLEGNGSGAEQTLIDLGHPDLAPRLGEMAPQLGDFIAHGIVRIVDLLGSEPLPDAARMPLGAVALQAPLPRPPRIVGVAHNYHDALAERGTAPPAEPVLFEKDPATVIGPGAAIVLPAGVGGVTYEAELAAVIGRRAEDITIAEALGHVAGYPVFNDITASGKVRRDRALAPGKNFPTFGPFGPWFATADEIPDPQALRVEMLVEDCHRQDSSTAQMLFSVAELIAILSRQAPLEPGTVIATGTPAGVAPVQKPPTWLQPGTTISARVEGLGTLSNPVVEGKPAHA